MEIKAVKNAFKIADVELVENSKKLKFVYLENLKDESGNPLTPKILKDNVARVYIIVVDGVIKKIGGSQAKGGMKKTLAIYQDGGVGGRPSIRSYGVWHFLYQSILKKAKIEFYMIYQESFETKIKGFWDFNVKKSYVSYKLLEECCMEDYLKNENGHYPEWNVQEQGADWPQEIKENHSKLTNKSLERETSRKKIKNV